MICFAYFVSSSCFGNPQESVKIAFHFTPPWTIFQMSSCAWLDCTAQFDNLSDLVDHISEAHLNHLKAGEYSCSWKDCDRLGQTFHNRSALNAHIRRHTGEKPFTCKVCGSTFARSDALSKHLKGHGELAVEAESKTVVKRPSETLGPIDYILENLLLENMYLKRKLNSNMINSKRLSVENAFLVEAIKDALQSTASSVKGNS